MDFASIMTPDPVTVAPTTRCGEAARLLDEHGVRHLPVLEAQRTVGLISDRELLSAAPDLAVAEVMLGPVQTVRSDERTPGIGAELELREAGCLLVVDDGRLIGIVSEYDLVHAFVEAVREGRLTGADDPAVEGRMASPFESLELGATLGEAARVQLALRVRHLPVMENRRPVGMLSDRDLRRALGQGAKLEDDVDAHVSRPAVTVAPGARLSEAAALMRDRKLGALLVADGGNAVGLITLSDVLDHCARELHLREL